MTLLVTLLNLISAATKNSKVTTKYNTSPLNNHLPFHANFTW